ncbi:FtsX-like permease family protein [Zavarzinella formosa]|uniref:FtsX-like permease family protein n=1 Tax=Zavarzinella formosa TaxID=360055 RepID=UPI0002EE3C9E|nr:FtsX-like permease family protein [Zavarzinella formosa]
MISILRLAWFYLRFHPWKTGLQVTAVMLVLAVPGILWTLARQGEHHLTERAAKTPLLIGSRGSPLELTLNSLYFRSDPLPPMKFGEVKRIEESGLGDPIPLYVRFKSQRDPVVGTAPEYFPFRGLRLKEGDGLGRLGDCVAGSRVAARRGIKTGDFVVSSPEQAFDVAGVMPLRMRVTGVLAESGTPDDDAIFTSLRTTWVIAGIGHGHENPDMEHAVPGATPTYMEVTDANVNTFHFHGNRDDFPVSALIVMPGDEKSATRLIGRYQSPENPLQIVEPDRVMSGLLDTVVTIRAFALAALALVGLATVLLLGVLQALSFRIRRREIEILHQLGASRWRVRMLLASDAAGVFFLGALLAAGLTLLASGFGPATIRGLMSR